MLHWLATENSIQELQRRLGNFVTNLGFQYYSYAFSDYRSQDKTPTTGVTLVSSYPLEWVNRYVRFSYHLNDPILAASRLQRRPFIWSTKDRNFRVALDQRRIVDEMRGFEILCGVTVPLHGPGSEVAFFTAAWDKDEMYLSGMNNFTINTVHLIALYIHLNFLDPPSDVLKSETAGAKQPALSPREIECLFWTARGKTSWEISKIITRSEATVNFHLRKAMAKLNASNKCEAATRAVTHGLITPHSACNAQYFNNARPAITALTLMELATLLVARAQAPQ